MSERRRAIAALGRAAPGGHPLARALILLMGLLVAAPAAAGGEAWLITYGPGADSWSRFGHNAIMLRGDGRGERNYAFGYFDMTRPGFVADFIRGDMVYEGRESDTARELAQYRRLDRSVRRQRLALDEAEFERLRTLLEDNVAPGNRRYDYDYYYRNCSTRLRDLLDRALDGALEERFSDQPAELGFRGHTHRLSQDDFWFHTGLMLVLGPGIDGERSAWEEMFLPDVLADSLAAVRIDGEPLVVADDRWHESSRYAAPAEPSHRWAGYAGLGALTVAVLLLPTVATDRRWRWLPLGVYTAASAAAGAGLLFLWFGSSHEAIHANAVLLLLNPLWLAVWWRGSRRYRTALAAVLAATTVCGAIVLAWPEGYQYRPGPLLWLVPANAAALAAAVLRWRSRGVPEAMP